LIDRTFSNRRARSLLYPVVSFIFDEADVFIQRRERGEDIASPSVIEQATLLARRGRKFGLGLGIATQRIRYLDSSIMAQPHTYFISKLPRASDRQAIAEAFAISDESLEQTFAFTTGQWLVASHDATGLKSTPFPVQLPNANDAVRQWLAESQLL
jgi:DNA helicase HerA-like ATPase